MSRPTWLKILLLVLAIVFVLYGFLGVPPGSNEFTLHFVSVLVEMCFGAFITYAIIDEIFRRDKRARLKSVLESGNWEIAKHSTSIVYTSLMEFIPGTNGSDRERMNNIVETIRRQTEKPEPDVLTAMWDGFKLWENLFFIENAIEPKRDFSELAISVFEDVNRYIRYIKNLTPRFEETALELDQIEIIFGFERVVELIEDMITDYRKGKEVNLMLSLRSLIGVSIHMYNLCLVYYNSNHKLEDVEFYNYG